MYYIYIYPYIYISIYIYSFAQSGSKAHNEMSVHLSRTVATKLKEKNKTASPLELCIIL